MLYNVKLGMAWMRYMLSEKRAMYWMYCVGNELDVLLWNWGVCLMCNVRSELCVNICSAKWAMSQMLCVRNEQCVNAKYVLIMLLSKRVLTVLSEKNELCVAAFCVKWAVLKVSCKT